MKSNKTLQVILIIIVAAIWISVFYRIFFLSKKDDEGGGKEKVFYTMNQTFIQGKLNKLKIDFKKAHITDPFRPFAIKKAYKKPVKQSKTADLITAPAYLLQGIVWDEINPKAILVKSKIYKDEGKMKIGETIIVEKNNLIDYGKVLDISENYVIIITYNKKFKLKSNFWEKID